MSLHTWPCHHHNCHCKIWMFQNKSCHVSAVLDLHLTLSRLTRCTLLSWSMIFISILLSLCSIPSLSCFPSLRLPTPQTPSPVLSKPHFYFQQIRCHLCHCYPPHKGAQTGKRHYSSLSTGSWQAQSSPPSKDPDPAHQGTHRAPPSTAHQILASAQPILTLTLPFSSPLTHAPFLLSFVICPKVSD